MRVLSREHLRRLRSRRRRNPLCLSARTWVAEWAESFLLAPLQQLGVIKTKGRLVHGHSVIVDQLPANHVLVAAISWVGEEAGDDVGANHFEIIRFAPEEAAQEVHAPLTLECLKLCDHRHLALR